MRYTSREIGKLLRDARVKKSLTQADLASRINKKRSYISRLENDKVSINLRTLQEIVEVGLGGKISIEV